MILFLSYTRKDQSHIGPLAEGLRFASHDPWFDERLSGGEEWWQAILKRIRSSDVFVAVVSQASLASTACTREREYALRLGKPILPVAIEDVPTQALPPDLARRQIVDFATPDMTAAFRLAGGINALPPTPSLPDPLPPEPEIPLSYLSDLSRLISAPTLTIDEQFAITGRLRDAVRDEEDFDAAIELGRLLQKRRDLYAVTERQLQEVLSSRRPQQSSGGDRRKDSPRRTARVAGASTGTGSPKPRMAIAFSLGVFLFGLVLSAGLPALAIEPLPGLVIAVGGLIWLLGTLIRRG
jgi:TIR domain